MRLTEAMEYFKRYGIYNNEDSVRRAIRQDRIPEAFGRLDQRFVNINVPGLREFFRKRTPIYKDIEDMVKEIDTQIELISNSSQNSVEYYQGKLEALEVLKNKLSVLLLTEELTTEAMLDSFHNRRWSERK